jgi:citrate synthase
VTDWWATAMSEIRPGVIRLRGYPVEELIQEVSFAQTIWLMTRGKLPTPAQACLLERALVAAVDHGPQAPSIAAGRMAATCGVGLNNAVATGVNLLGDVHGGAGQQCMTLRPLVDRDHRGRLRVRGAGRRTRGSRHAGRRLQQVRAAHGGQATPDSSQGPVRISPERPLFVLCRADRI